MSSHGNYCGNCQSCMFDIKNILEKVYYEIHITVKYDEKFIIYCEKQNIKLVHIDMGDNVPKHLMTSISRSFCNDKECYYYTDDIKNKIIAHGFNIERIKIEVSPSHRIAINNPVNYFESHFAVLNPDEGLSNIKNLHKSSNLMKKNSKNIQMLTFRKKTSLNDFKVSVNSIEHQLLYSGYILDKIIIEYCLYDSNEQMDKQWFLLNNKTND